MWNRLQRQRAWALEQLERREMLSVGLAGLLQPKAQVAGVSATDDYGNTMATAAQVSLSTAGSASQSGKIELAGDVDVLKFVAPTTGKITVQELAATGSRLDTYVYVYNASGQLLAANDDYGGSLNSRVDVNVTAGATYYVKAAAYGSSTGAYNVQFATTATTTPTPSPKKVHTPGTPTITCVAPRTTRTNLSASKPSLRQATWETSAISMPSREPWISRWVIT